MAAHGIPAIDVKHMRNVCGCTARLTLINTSCCPSHTDVKCMDTIAVPLGAPEAASIARAGRMSRMRASVTKQMRAAWRRLGSCGRGGAAVLGD